MEETIARHFVRAPVPRCSKCKNYLSFGPITLSSNRPVCGRCNTNSDGSGVFYETLAQEMIFPCINDIYGCDVQCPWGQVESHENSCWFCPTECPDFNCNQKILGETVLQHYQTDHPGFILSKAEFELKRERDDAKECSNLLFVWNTEVFIVKRNFSDKCCYCCLLSWKNPSQPNMKYSITIENAENNDAVCIRDIAVRKYEEKFHDISEMTKIDLELMAKLVNSEHLICFFNLDNASSRDRLLNENLLSEFECPICTEYMRPPIFSCLSGHIVCRSCFGKLSKCPSCRANWHDSNIVAIEKIAEHICYPCKYRDSGCSVTGTLSDLSNHESECRHLHENKTGCYLSLRIPCNWQGLPSCLMSHIAQAHPDNYIDIKNSIVLNMVKFKNTNAFTEYDNNIFRVFMDKYGNDLHVTVILVVNQRDVIVPIYHYLLNFIDPNDCGRFLSLNNICSPSLAIDDSRKNTLVIDKYLNNLFLKHDTIEFKLSIVKYGKNISLR